MRSTSIGRLRCVRSASGWMCFFDMQEIAQNRPREQDFDAWQASVEVKAVSARFFVGRKAYAPDRMNAECDK